MSPSVLRRWLLAGGLLLGLAVAAVIGSASGRPATARAATTGQLSQQIAGGRARVSSLAGTVAAQTRRLDQIDAGIAATQTQLSHLQDDLVAKRVQLLRLRDQLTASRARLSRLIATETADEQVLADQLVGSYEGGQPNLVSVVLNATGFNELLEQLDFATRISHRNTQVTTAVRAARRAVAAQAIHLGALEQTQQSIVDAVQSERNRVADVRIQLVSQQLSAARTRATTAGHLAGARAQVASLSIRLAQLQAAQRAAAQRAAQAAAARAAAAQQAAAAQRAAAAQQAAAARRAAAAAPTPSAPRAGSAPVATPPAPAAPAPAVPSPAAPAPSSGGFSFPLPISAAGPPSTWSPDDGVDITAPGGTPEYAVCSGTVVLHGIGGFGPSAPVIHCDSPLDGYSYVYYGHAGPGNWTPIGAHVSQGQVISEVGYGDVGISTGPHLEIGFADSSGNPIGPSSAGTMLALLHAAY